MAVWLSALRAGRPLPPPPPPGRFLILASGRGWVDPRAIVRLEGLGANQIFSWRNREINTHTTVGLAGIRWRNELGTSRIWSRFAHHWWRRLLEIILLPSFLSALQLRVSFGLLNNLPPFFSPFEADYLVSEQFCFYGEVVSLIPITAPLPRTNIRVIIIINSVTLLTVWGNRQKKGETEAISWSQSGCEFRLLGRQKAAYA
jgi:hypothetical protein